MAIGRGKPLALSVTVLAVGVLVAAGVAVNEPIAERWYVYKLRSDSLDVAAWAAMKLGRRASARAVRPVLEAMRRFTVARGKTGVWLFVGPDHRFEHEPTQAPTSSWKHLSFLKFFQQLGVLAVPRLLEAMQSEDPMVVRLAATVFVCWHNARGEYRSWFHGGRFYRLEDARSALMSFKDDATQPPELRSRSADLLASIGRRSPR